MSTPSFALIAEGETDHEVLRHLLAGYFTDPDIIVNQIQPATDRTAAEGKAAGGWTEVFRFCGSDKFAAAFQYNDHVLIQLDTDVCEEAGYGVSRRHPDGRERSVDEMVDATRDRLVEVIGADIYTRHSTRIIFAICVDSIECWLLPLYYSDNRRAKHVNCLGTLNEQLSRREGFSIAPERKQLKYYRKIVRKKDLVARADDNPSLRRFVTDLRTNFPRMADNSV